MHQIAMHRKALKEQFFGWSCDEVSQKRGCSRWTGALLLVVGTVLAPQASAQPGEGPGPETNPLITTAPVLPPPESAPMPVSTAFAETAPPRGGGAAV